MEDDELEQEDAKLEQEQKKRKACTDTSQVEQVIKQADEQEKEDDNEVSNSAERRQSKRAKTPIVREGQATEDQVRNALQGKSYWTRAGSC